MTLKVLIMAGGTGGHVFPALAVAEVLRKQNVDIEWMGTQKGIENKLVPEAGYALNYITVQGLRGNGVLGWLLAPFKLVQAVIQALKVIKRFKPDAVLGLGGFASGPGGIAAKLMAKPLIIHEQNAIPGLTNRILAMLANRVLQGFPNSFKSSVQAQWVGNPVRNSIEMMAEPAKRMAGRQGNINVLVLGGSLGAYSLNSVLPQAFSLLTNSISVKHQCGIKHQQQCQLNYQQAKVEADIVSFIDDMAQAYQWADLVICRAGALTIAELSAAGVASLLIPYPYAVDDHQTHNASALVTAGGALLMQEQDLSVESISQVINNLVSDRSGLLTMAQQARDLTRVGSAKQIASLCLEQING